MSEAIRNGPVVGTDLATEEARAKYVAMSPERMAQLLAAFRAGDDDAGSKLEGAYQIFVYDLPFKCWSTAFEALRDAIETLKDNTVTDVECHVRQALSRANKARRRTESEDILPEHRSTYDRRKKRNRPDKPAVIKRQRFTERLDAESRPVPVPFVDELVDGHNFQDEVDLLDEYKHVRNAAQNPLERLIMDALEAGMSQREAAKEVSTSHSTVQRTVVDISIRVDSSTDNAVPAPKSRRRLAQAAQNS